MAEVDILSDMSRAEAVWRDLEARRASQTPYQRFDFLSAWQREVGEREQLTPFIVVAWDGERKPLALLPLARGRQHGIEVASFMGGKHANFNMALWDRDFATSATRADLDALVAAIAQSGGCRPAGALSAAPRLARAAQSDGAVAASVLGQ